MITMQAHGIDQRSDTSALANLSKIAVDIIEFVWLLHDPNNSGNIGNPGDIGV